MSNVHKIYRYKKSDVYPRVSYFQRMLDSLLTRFKKVFAHIDEFYLDKHRIEDIEKVVRMLLRPPCVIIVGGSDVFDVSRTVAYKGAFHSLAYEEIQPADIGADDLVMTAIVYYYKESETVTMPKPLLATSISEVGKKININRDSENPQSAYVIRPNSLVTSKLFIAVDVCVRVGTIDPIKNHIAHDLTLTYGEDLVKNRLMVGEQADVGCLISSDLESRVFLGFDNIDNYLREFRRHDPSCYMVAKTLKDDRRISEFLLVSFSNRESLDYAMKDTISLQEGFGALSGEDVFFSSLVILIASGLKCIVTQILFERFSLSLNLVHQCLEKVEFFEKVKLSFKDDNVIKSQICSLSDDEDSDKKKKDTHPKNVTSKESELTKAFINGLENVFAELEKEVIEVNKSIEIVKKMNFEISGYYKRTETREERTIPKVSTSKELQTELFRCKDVIGCGFIYGIFEVLIREDNTDEAIEDTVKSIMDHHRYIGQYTIKRVLLDKSGF